MMNKLLRQIEIALEHWASLVIEHPKKVLVFTLLFVIAMATGVSRIYTDVSNESLFKLGNPALQSYNSFRDQFGKDDAVIALVRSPEIFTPKFMERLHSFQQALKDQVPHLDRVLSMANVSFVSKSNGDLLIDELRKQWPSEAGDFDAFRENILSNPLYRDRLISADGQATLLIIQSLGTVPELDDKNERSNPEFEMFSADLEQKMRPLSNEELGEFVDAIRAVSEKHDGPNFEILLGGGDIINVEHIEAIRTDMGRIIPLVFLFVFITLLVTLRSLSSILLTISVVSLTLASTYGVMGWLSIPITPVVIAIPPLVLTMGVGYVVHLLGIYFREYSKANQLEESIRKAIHRTALAILFTSITTAAGFLSFSIAEIKAISEFGLVCAISALLALFFTLTIAPAVLKIFKLKANARQLELGGRFVDSVTTLSFNNPWKVSLGVILIVAFLTPGVMQLRFSHDLMAFFKEDQPARVNTMSIDKQFNGTIPLEVVVNTGKEKGLLDPDLLRKVEQFQVYAEKLKVENIEMGRAISIVDTLKLVHKNLDGNKSLPDTQTLVAQEMLLIENSGSEEISRQIDSQYSKLRITIGMAWADAIDYIPAREKLQQAANEIFQGSAQVNLTGAIDLISRGLAGVITSMSTSYLLAGTVITLMLIVISRSLSLGLIGMIPNFLPIYITLGLMGYVDYPINMFTVTLGGIALGIAVDDTVHFIHNYRYHRDERGMNVKDSLHHTAKSVGPALLFTTVAITTGFAMLMLSELDSMFYFGLFLSITIFNALLADLLIVPAVLRLAERLKALNKTRKTTLSQEATQ
ncbi:MAG: efflux RND transporter permease subunit [Gammaproteobacteria bacterium]|nr:efflux RND transporter permease subunit [Gammaproteobacteria bacterium]MDH5692967.1 efflux RND transporter permease subunit [Gammaproteobacteria bacterium]